MELLVLQLYVEECRLWSSLCNYLLRSADRSSFCSYLLMCAVYGAPHYAISCCVLLLPVSLTPCQGSKPRIRVLQICFSQRNVASSIFGCTGTDQEPG